MAALLESLLQKTVQAEEAVRWLRRCQDNNKDRSLREVQRQEFVPFLLNFLREQSSHALANGPATPAKTPASHPLRTVGSSGDRRGCKAGGGAGHRSASRVRLFSPAPSLSPVVGTERETPSEPQCLSGVSTHSSPSFGTGWSPSPRATPTERRSDQRVSLGDFLLSPMEAQSSSAPRRGRRRSGGAGAFQGRQSGGRGRHEEAGTWEAGRRSLNGGGSRTNASLSPTPVQLNFSNLEDFPPVGASPVSPVLTKPSRRINPTPVSAERPLSKPKSCFTSTPFSKLSDQSALPAGTDAAQSGGKFHSLQEERELLRKEKSKIAQQVSSPAKPTQEPCTPTKPSSRAGTRVAPDAQVSPEPMKVTFSSELDLLAELYCTCIAENLVPSVFLELFFVLQLLTSRASPASGEEEEREREFLELNMGVLERRYLGSLHNCVYFAVRVLESQLELVCHLDRCTLRLLAENERVGSFCPSLREQLNRAQETSMAEVSAMLPAFIQSVPFQPATDNRSNFSSNKAFHTFKKQRDIFYELLREWEDSHNDPGWEFEQVLGSKVREMVSQVTTTGNHYHFARLFQKQLVQMCKGTQVNSSPGDAPDPDLLGMLGADNLGRLKRLQERLIQPQGFVGPCPPPSFPGYQEFFRDFLQAAGSCQLNQHLTDSLCQELLQLDEVAILGLGGTEAGGEGEGDMEQQDEKQRFSSVLLTARLLAKFLGFITFLPYQTAEPIAKQVQEAAISIRNKSCPVLDVCTVLRSCVRRRRMVLTVPWLVEFLSMLDFVGPFLLCYRTALGMLLCIYRRMVLGKREDMSYLNRLLLVAVMGWLFQIPVFPEELFFHNDFEMEMEVTKGPAAAQGLDCLPLVDQQLLYNCCPYLKEFRKLLAAFVAGSTAKSGGLIRKITPTSAEPRGCAPIHSQQKLQVELEQAFFHNQPPSLRRTVEFVAERVGSNCVKHIKATLVLELVRTGEMMLKERLITDNGATALKLSDSVCAQLCDCKMQTLELAARYCSEKGPEAVRVLLPEETSPTVFATSERITVRLATEKARNWLSSNITALIKREWKTAFQRVMKAQPSSPMASGNEHVVRALVGSKEQSAPPQGVSEGEDRATRCPPGCTHNVAMPSDIINDIKEVLSIAVGPSSEDECLSVCQLEDLLRKLAETLHCRKFLTPVSEQMLLRCTVQLACMLVSVGSALVSPLGFPETNGSTKRTVFVTESLLEQLISLWGQDWCPPAPLHLLFTKMTITSVLNTEAQWQNYLFLAKQLMDKGLLRGEALSHWKKLSETSWTPDLMMKMQQLTFVMPDLLQTSRERMQSTT
ncbi:codanin-1 isoform X2 [Scleropages formosus]|uniref:Codanin 1 n=1 Tax=Scleropages formosus TaxID=113540 RepID=A0A8C9RB45_SCLFO|nr:codanin-1 isoform X2 [Scleropages formosus]